ncbi:MAG TPA: M20/M25/M40 family metallo-hydrolase [Pyrinomonadaceae bacterium]
MRRFITIFVLTVSLVVPLPAALAQKTGGGKTGAATATSVISRRGVEQITAAQLKDYLYFIASDEMEGRDTPSRGLDTTAKFIAMNLSRWHFKPAGDDGTFFQRISLRRDRIDVANTRAEINGQPFAAGKDFIAFSNPGTATGPLVYAGHGWLIKSKGIDAYQGIDVKDKIVVINGSEDIPQGVTFADLSGGRPGVDWADPLTHAEKGGAKGIIAIASPQVVAGWETLRQRRHERPPITVEKFAKENAPARIPRIIVGQSMAAALLAGEKQTLEAIVAGMVSRQPVPAFEFGPEKKVTFTVAVKPEQTFTQNVVAIWEGADPVLKNEYVATGAHYDHVGVGTPASNGDSIYNGADDDGSGTTAVLAMAEALSHAKERPRRSVLFVWHCGEEKGLWGSKYFTENPTVPLDRVVAQLNIDMIGRSKKDGDTNPANRELSGPNEIYVIGSKMMSTDLGELSDRVNRTFLNLAYNFRYDDPKDPNRFFFRSDHFNYARKGVPIVFFFDGVHEDYHRPGDEPQKIDYVKMEKVTRTVYQLLWEVTSLPTRPAVDKPLPQQLRGN